MKFNITPITPNTCAFSKLLPGDSFFTIDGHLGIKAMPVGEANVVILKEDKAWLTAYGPEEMVVPCNIVITSGDK